MRERDSIRRGSYARYEQEFPEGVISTPYAVERAERIMRMVERQCIVSFFAGGLFMLVVILMARAL